MAIAHSTELGRNRKWGLPVILNLNARSLSGEKLDELLVTVTDHNVSVVCINETWFIEYIENCSVSIQGFSLEKKDRS